MNRFHLILYSALFTLFGSLGVITVLSLLPYLHWIGGIALGSLSVCLLCGLRIMVAFTGATVQRLRVHANVIRHNDILAYYGHEGFVHLSAEHERAKLKSPTVVTEVANPPNNETAQIRTILSEYDYGNGKTMKAIAKEQNVPLPQVEAIIKEFYYEPR